MRASVCWREEGVVWSMSGLTPPPARSARKASGAALEMEGWKRCYDTWTGVTCVTSWRGIVLARPPSLKTSRQSMAASPVCIWVREEAGLPGWGLGPVTSEEGGGEGATVIEPWRSCSPLQSPV